MDTAQRQSGFQRRRPFGKRSLFERVEHGLGQSVAAISKLAPTAHIGQGLSIYYSGGSAMPGQVEEWLAATAGQA